MKIGIVGGGQLARMLVLAGYPMGLQFQVLDPAIDACAGEVAPLIRSDYDDENHLRQLADWAEVLTFDFENVPATVAATLKRQAAGFYPPAEALAVAQDRLYEKTLFWELGIPTPPFATIDSLEELRDRYSDRVFSRITSHYDLCKLTGPDIRMCKKRMQNASDN